MIRPCDPTFSSIVHSFPSVIQVEPTNRCNFKCKICPRFSADYEQKNLDLSLNNFKLIMSNFPKISKVILYGRGEPFLNGEIFDMIKLLKDRDITVSTLTNGSLLNSVINKQVIDSGIDDISFSIDSADPIINDKLRVGANLNSMLPNIKNLVKNGKNIKFGICTAIASENLIQLQNIVYLAQELGIDYISLQEFQFKHNPSLKELNPSVSCAKRATAIYEKLAALAEDVGVRIDIARYSERKKWANCTWAWGSMYIHSNGNISPCCDSDYVSMGNIFSATADNIWNNEKYIDFRKDLIEGRIPSPCKGCQYL